MYLADGTTVNNAFRKADLLFNPRNGNARNQFAVWSTHDHLGNGAGDVAKQPGAATAARKRSRSAGRQRQHADADD